MAGRLGWTCCFLMCGALVTGGAWAQGAPGAQEQAAALPGVAALPDEPTPDEVAIFLHQIAEATAALPQEPRRDDPQAAMLGALADDFLDELFQAHEAYPQLRYYLDPIIHREIARRGGPDGERLAGITLAPDADDDAAWSYILDIARVTAGQRRVSATDPQVLMLEALAEDNMPALIDALEIESLRFYATLAIKTAVSDDHKETILAALTRQPRLIGVVRQMGWADDARDQLIAGLEQGITASPRTWVQVVVELRDPATYDALALHLTRSRCSMTYYSLMHDLPGIDLAPAVHAAWERVAFTPTDPREMREVATVAVRHGHHDALGYLIGLLPTDDAAETTTNAELRRAVLDSIEFAGTNAEVKAWYAAHRDRLRFSEADRFFYVSGMLQ